MSTGKITGETTIEEVLKNPRAALVLREHGIPCPTCPMARFEMSKLKVRDVAKAYGVDLEKLLTALNEAVEKKSSGPERAMCC